MKPFWKCRVIRSSYSVYSYTMQRVIVTKEDSLAKWTLVFSTVFSAFKFQITASYFCQTFWLNTYGIITFCLQWRVLTNLNALLWLSMQCMYFCKVFNLQSFSASLFAAHTICLQLALCLYLITLSVVFCLLHCELFYVDCFHNHLFTCNSDTCKTNKTATQLPSDWSWLCTCFAFTEAGEITKQPSSLVSRGSSVNVNFCLIPSEV